MDRRFRHPLVLILLSAARLSAETWEYIRNDSVELGVLSDYGAGIGSFASRRDGRNLLNHADPGRLVQQSWYGDPDGSAWNGKPWRWNPVQGGCWKGQAGTVLEHRNTGATYYARVRPRNWGGCEEIDGSMEEWISLEGPLARIRFRFTNGSRDNAGDADQEMPALFADHALPNLAYYEGNAPWTGATLARRVPGWPNSGAAPSESWAAYLDDSGRGVGAYFPGIARLTCYRYAGDGKEGPSGSACSYFAPLRRLRIRAGDVLEYEVCLRIGPVEAIRRDFASLHAAVGLGFKVAGPKEVFKSGFPPGLAIRPAEGGRVDAIGRIYNRIWIPARPSTAASR